MTDEQEPTGPIRRLPWVRDRCCRGGPGGGGVARSLDAGRAAARTMLSPSPPHPARPGCCTFRGRGWGSCATSSRPWSPSGFWSSAWTRADCRWGSRRLGEGSGGISRGPRTPVPRARAPRHPPASFLDRLELADLVVLSQRAEGLSTIQITFCLLLLPINSR